MTKIKIIRARNQKYLNLILDLDLLNISTKIKGVEYWIGDNIDSLEKLNNQRNLVLSKKNIKGYSVVNIDEFEIL